MVTMRKNEFKLYMLNVIEHLEEGSEAYARFCDIFLTMCGVVDEGGNLSESYESSPYWTGGDDGTPLRASFNAELMASAVGEVRGAVEEMENALAEKDA